MDRRIVCLGRGCADLAGCDTYLCSMMARAAAAFRAPREVFRSSLSDLPKADHHERGVVVTMAAQAAERLAAGPWWKPGDLVFTNRQGGFLAVKDVYAAYHRVLDRAGLPRVRFHHVTQTLQREAARAVDAALQADRAVDDAVQSEE